VAVAPLAAQATAKLEGTVRDARGRPLAGATVYLQVKATGQTLTAHTDPTGGYTFTELNAGGYLLRAEGSGSGEAHARLVILGEAETKRADLTLEYAFFDEPNLIVAGVTDPVSHGGHGSDTVRRSAEALAQATASLGAAEKPGSALEAARAYQRAAEAGPSESNLFDWGTELLIHRAPEQAAEVFEKGHRLFPRSQRMLLGLAAAGYAHGDYDRSAHSFFEACDLNPADPGPYIFLGKVQSIEIVQLQGYLDRLARFQKLHPDSAWANYYYAVALWKQRKGPEDSQTPARVQKLLQNAVRLDPALGAAYLQLGVVYSAQKGDTRAIAAYQKAIAVSPEMDEPHYRLGQAYERTGQKEKARQELDTYEEMSKKLQQRIERERSEIQQFVFELRN
jgi:tetratricopeptide (TPR) repeat protein